MNPAKIVVQEVQRQHVDMVVDLLRESVCQSGKSAVTHADRQVRALYMRRGNMVKVRVAGNVLFD